MDAIGILLMVLLFVTAVFLIILVLIQRGKGGGLAGAFGGMGGQSAFGTKAGDLFTRITIGVAAFWIVICIFAVKYLGSRHDLIDAGLGGESPAKPGLTAPPSTESEEPDGNGSPAVPAAPGNSGEGGS